MKNLGIKILSLVLAAMFWIVITTVEDPPETKRIYGVEVKINNSDLITDQNKVYEILSGSEVDIVVEGRTSILNGLDKNDFRATADMSELTPPWESVAIKVDCPEYDYLPTSQFSYRLGKTNVLKVTLEDKETMQFPIKVEPSGTPEEGYALGDMKASPKMVSVTGAKSQVEKIDQVKAIVRVTGVTENIKQKVELTAYDKSGKALDSTKFKFSVEKVNVSVAMLNTKTVPVFVNTKGSPGTNYAVTKLDYQPQEIMVKGYPSDLDKLASINVDVDVSNRSVSWDAEVNVSDYLPEGIQVADENTSVVISVTLEKVEHKEIRLSYENIAIKNASEQYQIRYRIPENTNLQTIFAGKKELVDTLTVSNIHAFVDLSGLSEGTHTVNVQFELPDGVTAITAPSIQVELFLQPSDNPTPEPGATVTPIPEVSPSVEPTDTPEPDPTDTNEPVDPENTVTEP